MADGRRACSSWGAAFRSSVSCARRASSGFTSSASTPTPRHRRGVCDEFHEVSTHDVDAIVRVARSKRRARHHHLRLGARARQHGARGRRALGLPFYGDVATVDRCQAKDLMREAYRAGGAPIPAFACARPRSPMSKHSSRADGLPVIVKPSRGWGQRGVSQGRESCRARAALTSARDDASSTGIVLVEEFVEGARVQRQRLHPRRQTIGVQRDRARHHALPRSSRASRSPSGIRRGSIAPTKSRRSPRRSPECARSASAAAPRYTQLRIGPNGAQLVETAYRLGGGLDPDVALLASGISLFRKILGRRARASRIGKRAGPESDRHGGAIGKFLGRAARAGSSRIHGLDEARRHARRRGGRGLRRARWRPCTRSPTDPSASVTCSRSATIATRPKSAHRAPLRAIRIETE